MFLIIDFVVNIEKYFYNKGRYLLEMILLKATFTGFHQTSQEIVQTIWAKPVIQSEEKNTNLTLLIIDQG